MAAGGLAYKRKVEICGVQVAAGMPVVLNWTAANRDPAVFADPDRFDPESNAADNLVYGIGPHVCPDGRWRRWSCGC